MINGILDAKLVIPDFSWLKKTQDDSFDLIDSYEDAVLPAGRELLLGLKNCMLDVERSLQEAVVDGIALLQGRTFSNFKDPHILNSRIATVLRQQDQLRLRLMSQTRELQLFSLAAFEVALPALEQKAGDKGAETEKLSQRLATLETKRDDIAHVISTFEKPSVFKAFKGLIPKEEDIDLILAVTKDPSVTPELLKAASKRLSAYIDEFEKNITVSDLIAARRGLDQKIAEAKKDLANSKRALQVALDQLSANKAIWGLESTKNDWLAQVRKVEQEWQSQADALGSLSDPNAVTVALADLCNYLVAVRLSYENA